MAGRISHIERHTLDREFLAIGQPHRDHVGFCPLTHDSDAMRFIAERAETGNMVGMHVGIDGFDKIEIELFDELQVAINLFQDGVDDQRLTAAAAGE